MKHLNRYESFFKIREGLEKGLDKFIHLKDLFRLARKTGSDDLAKILTNLVDNLGDDAANKLEELMGRVIKGKNVEEIDGKYWIVSTRNAKMSLELLSGLIKGVSTEKTTVDEIVKLLPDELPDGFKFRTEMGEVLKRVKPKSKTTPKPEVKEEGSTPKPKADTDVLIGQNKLNLNTEQIEQTFKEQQDVYDKLRNLQDWNRLKGVFEKVDDKQDVLGQLEKIGFGPGSAVRSKAFIEAIGEKNLVNFWNDMVNMKDSFKEMSQSDLMKLIEERMSRLESKSLGLTDKDKKNLLSKLKFTDRKRRAALIKWGKYTLVLAGVSWWLYMTFVNDKKEKPESKDTGEENTDQSTEQQTGGESSNTEQKKTSRKSNRYQN